MCLFLHQGHCYIITDIYYCNLSADFNWDFKTQGASKTSNFMPFPLFFTHFFASLRIKSNDSCYHDVYVVKT